MTNVWYFSYSKNWIKVKSFGKYFDERQALIFLWEELDKRYFGITDKEVNINKN